tara:strand:+ start:220 stop:366 length:147 start_codon:yes stop_codon:yes gene_type:complete
MDESVESLKKIIIFLVKIRRTSREHEMNVDALIESMIKEYEWLREELD